MTDIPNLDDFSVVSDGPAPIAKKGFDWKKSNGVKIGVAAGLVLLTVLIFGWQFGLFGGSGKSKIAANPSGGTNPTPNNNPAPPPPPPPPVTPPAAPSNTPAEPQQTPPPSTAQPGSAPVTPGAPGPTPGYRPGMPPGYGPPGMPPGYGPPGMPPGYGPPGAQPGTNPPGVEPLPDDITKWKKDDYLRARRENHPKLAEAVFYASRNTGRNENSAQAFIDLLKPVKVQPNPDEPPGSYVPPPAMASPQLIESLVNALADNGTPPAKETLKGILTGDFSTDDDRTAVDAVIKSMAYHPSPENDALLLQMLTQPQSVRKAVPLNPASPMNPQMTISPSDLRMKAQEAIKLSASDKLRLSLAEHYAKSGIDPNDQTVQLLLQEDPVNLSAQLVLYKADEISNETKTKLEQYFLDYASLAVGLTMGIPSGVEGMAMGGALGMPGGGPGMPPGYGPPRYGPPGYGPPGMPPGYGPPGMPPGYRPGPPPGYGPPAAPPGGSERGFASPGEGTPSSDASAEKTTELDRGVKLAEGMWTSSLVASLEEELGEVRSLEKSARPSCWPARFRWIRCARRCIAC